jgi:hypothetical protein
MCVSTSRRESVLCIAREARQAKPNCPQCRRDKLIADPPPAGDLPSAPTSPLAAPHAASAPMNTPEEVTPTPSNQSRGFRVPGFPAAEVS